jgi:hypothetical protein
MSHARLLLPLIDELDTFEDRLRDLAHELVASIFAAELARRQAAGELADRDRADDDDDDAFDPRTAAEIARDAHAEEAAASATRTAGGPPGRGQWTRDLVISELATWLLGGNQVEAAFLVRHGHRALVTNAKKFFGRFEAALNAANLHLAKQFPEGIPSKKKAPTQA